MAAGLLVPVAPLGVLQTTSTIRSNVWAPGRCRRVPYARSERACVVGALTAESPAGTRPSLRHEHWEPLPPCRLVEDNRVFLEDHRVRAYEVGPDQRMTVLTVANLLQEAAGNHAVAMWGRSESGFASDPRLTELGLIFVMARLCIDMRRFPRWGELVRMETWFQAAGRVGAERQWLFQAGDSGEILGRASAQFVMLHAATRKLVKMPSSVRETSAWFQRSPPLSAIAAAQGRAKLPAVRSKGGVGAAGAGRNEGSDGAVAFVLASQHETTPLEVTPLAVTARRADMDMNGHVNNVAYLCWALESVPEAVHGRGTLRGVEADFMAESTAGQTIEGLARATQAPEWFEGGNVAFAHSLVRPDEGGGKATELARLRSTWEVPEDVAVDLRGTKS